MGKKIIFCADGTWNHPGDKDKVSTTDTNVYKLYKALLTTATQVPHYDDGVGADSSFLAHFLGGAFGEGLFQKIKEGYTTIAHDYNDGDSIYLFGFSRVAYTARSIAGMLGACGIPKTMTQQAIEDAFSAYRMSPQSSARAAAKADLVTKYGNRPVTIAMIGVWDTVGSLGIPSALGGVDPVKYGFLDTTLSPTVKAAFHAISIDERRKAFPPTLWVSEDVPGQIVEQVWFSGCHSNVGGGCQDAGLSDIALKWMMKRAKEQGLELDQAVYDKYQAIDSSVNSIDTISESWSLLWGLPQARIVPSDALVASSVANRLQHLASYLPGNLSLSAQRALAATYKLIDI